MFDGIRFIPSDCYYIIELCSWFCCGARDMLKHVNARSARAFTLRKTYMWFGGTFIVCILKSLEVDLVSLSCG